MSVFQYRNFRDSKKVSCRRVEAFFCRPYWFFANQGGVDFRPPMIGPFPYGD